MTTGAHLEAYSEVVCKFCRTWCRVELLVDVRAFNALAGNVSCAECASKLDDERREEEAAAEFDARDVEYWRS